MSATKKYMSLIKEDMITDYEKGLSLSKIAKHYNISHITARKYLIDWGVYKKQNRPNNFLRGRNGIQ